MANRYWDGEGPKYPHLETRQTRDLREDIGRALEHVQNDVDTVAPTPTGNDGYALIEVGGVLALRPIQETYVMSTFGITGLTTTTPSQEVGATAANPAFTAAYTAAPDSASFIDNQGNPALDVSVTPTAFTYAHTYNKTANNASVTFTLSATKGGVPASRANSIFWRPRGWWGVGVAGISDQAGIEGLPTNGLLASRTNSFTMSPGASEYIYYAYPAVYGAATFFVDGWEGGFDLISATVSMTRNGVTQDYRLYRSHNSNLGTTNVQVA